MLGRQLYLSCPGETWLLCHDVFKTSDSCAVLCCAVLEPDVLHVCANPKVQWYPSIILVKRSPNAGYLVLCQYTGTFVSSTMLFQMQHDLGTAGCPYPDGFS